MFSNLLCLLSINLLGAPKHLNETFLKAINAYHQELLEAAEVKRRNPRENDTDPVKCSLRSQLKGTYFCRLLFLKALLISEVKK